MDKNKLEHSKNINDLDAWDLRLLGADEAFVKKVDVSDEMSKTLDEIVSEYRNPPDIS